MYCQKRRSILNSGTRHVLDTKVNFFMRRTSGWRWKSASGPAGRLHFILIVIKHVLVNQLMERPHQMKLVSVTSGNGKPVGQQKNLVLHYTVNGASKAVMSWNLKQK